jgi:hypothetical protein
VEEGQEVVADRRIMRVEQAEPCRRCGASLSHKRARPVAIHSIAHHFAKDSGQGLVPGVAGLKWRTTCASNSRSSGRRRRWSSTSRITPKAARRSAKGSLLPVGFSSMAQKPVSVSILSASATATETGVGRHGVGGAEGLVMRAAGGGDGFGQAGLAA